MVLLNGEIEPKAVDLEMEKGFTTAMPSSSIAALSVSISRCEI